MAVALYKFNLFILNILFCFCILFPFRERERERIAICVTSNTSRLHHDETNTLYTQRKYEIFEKCTSHAQGCVSVTTAVSILNSHVTDSDSWRRYSPRADPLLRTVNIEIKVSGIQLSQRNLEHVTPL